MAKKASITVDTLVGVVLEACANDKATEKKVRMLLASRSGSDAVDSEIGKRLKSLTTGRSFHDWRTAPEFAETIDSLRTAITETLDAQDPKAAMARLWQLIEADGKIMERVDDSSGRIGGVLRDATVDLGRLLSAAGGDGSDAFAERVHKVFLENAYGVLDGLVEAVAGPASAARMNASTSSSASAMAISPRAAAPMRDSAR